MNELLLTDAERELWDVPEMLEDYLEFADRLLAEEPTDDSPAE